MVLNYIWIAFFLVAFIVACVRFVLEDNFSIFGEMVDGALKMAEFSVMDIALPLAGIMIFWMGMMKVAENSGLVNVFAQGMWPIFKHIFPEIPKGHPASGSIMMNFSANFLGLDNAATPLGIKAMKELQVLNPSKDTASNSQIMFLVLNTSGLTLIPSSIIALRAANHSAYPTDIFIPILLATTIATMVALTAVSLYQRINLLKLQFILPVIALLSIMASIVALIIHFSAVNASDIAEYKILHPDFKGDINAAVSSYKMGKYSSFAGAFIILGMLVSFIGYGAYKKINVYDSFIEGAKDGFGTVIQIIPYLVAMLVAISVFRTSGAMDYIIDGIRYLANSIFSRTEFVDALPTAMMRPLSGGGSRALMIESWNHFKIDSLQGHMTSVIQGSTETTFYTIAVYYGAVGIRNVRHTIHCGLIADFAGVTAAIILSYLFFAN
ncbi:MAG: hypothetical protein K1X56_12695 [Flavobacteriales bacterium]|nr:hypothetical protein [Flavobacteriales bacterium]